MPNTRSVTAHLLTSLEDRPHALFEALMRGDAATARRLLEAGTAPRAAPPALLFPVGNFSVLHAAVMGRCASTIPMLLAAGAPLDASVQLPANGGLYSEDAAPLKGLLRES